MLEIFEKLRNNDVSNYSKFVILLVRDLLFDIEEHLYEEENMRLPEEVFKTCVRNQLLYTIEIIKEGKDKEFIKDIYLLFESK